MRPKTRRRPSALNPTPTLATELPRGHWRIFVSVQAVVDRHKYWGQFLDVLNPEAVQHTRHVHPASAGLATAFVGTQFAIGDEMLDRHRDVECRVQCHRDSPPGAHDLERQYVRVVSDRSVK